MRETSSGTIADGYSIHRIRNLSGLEYAKDQAGPIWMAAHRNKLRRCRIYRCSPNFASRLNPIPESSTPENAWPRGIGSLS